MRIDNLIMKICTYFILIVLACIVLFPIIYAVMASFKTNQEILTNPGSIIPVNPTWENYKLIWTADNFNIGRMLINSTYYTLCNVAIAVMLAAMSGYVFARGEFPGKKIIFACFSALMFVKTGGLEVYPKFNILNLIH